MEDQLQANPPSPSEYSVVLRAAAGCYFAGVKDCLIIRDFRTSEGPVDILFASRFAPTPGFTELVLRGLRAEVRGTATSLRAAAEAFGNAARSLLPVLALCANIECEDLAFEIVFERTAGKTQREFFQQFLPDEPWTP